MSIAAGAVVGATSYPPPAGTPVPAAVTHWRQGVEHAGRSRWLAAARSFRRAVRAAPGDTLYWVNLANACRHMGEHERAAAAARRALEIESGHPLALRLLGEALAQQHRYEEAVAAFAQLEAAGVLEPDAMLQHAANLQALRRPVQAIDVLMRAAGIAPGMAQLHAMMATAFRDMALQKEAIECLKTVLALDPGNLQALAHLSYEKRHLCDWSDLGQDVQRLEAALGSLPQGLARRWRFS